MTAAGWFPPFHASVTDTGGGHVNLLVDRDTETYPPDQAHVTVTPAGRDDKGAFEELADRRAVELADVRAERDRLRMTVSSVFDVLERHGGFNPEEGGELADAGRLHDAVAVTLAALRTDRDRYRDRLYEESEGRDQAATEFERLIRRHRIERDEAVNDRAAVVAKLGLVEAERDELRAQRDQFAYALEAQSEEGGGAVGELRAALDAAHTQILDLADSMRRTADDLEKAVQLGNPLPPDVVKAAADRLRDTANEADQLGAIGQQARADGLLVDAAQQNEETRIDD